MYIRSLLSPTASQRATIASRSHRYCLQRTYFSYFASNILISRLQQPELIKVVKTVPPLPLLPTTSPAGSLSPIHNEPTQAVVKLPPPHLLLKPKYPSTSTPFPVLQTPEAATAPAANKPTPTTKPQSASPPPTTRTAKDPPPHLRQASAMALPSKASATNDSHQFTKKFRDSLPSHRKEHILTVEAFYSQIYVDDDSGFWGWKGDDRDAWDDTGQSSSDVSIVSGCISYILARPERSSRISPTRI